MNQQISPLAHDEDCQTGAEFTSPEAGFMLVAVIVMCALVLIALAVAAPVVAKDLRRDKEVESEHRAEQYTRAIRLYYRKTHAYPPSIDALKQSNNVRYLRQEYTDPLTGKADWKLIHQGEQKTTVKGFFGQELGGLSTGGLGSAAGMSSGVGTPIGGGGTSTIGATSALAGGFANATVGTPSTGTSGATGASGFSGASGSSGALGGGGPIVGVATARSGPSILTPNQQTTYETWEFWYDPRIEQMYQKGQQNGGIGSGGMGSGAASGATGSTGSSSFGSGSSSGSFGSSGSTASTGVTSSPNSSGTTPQP